MATKPLQSITFPGIDNVYTVPQVDNTNTQAGAAAEAKKTGDDIDALEEDITELKDNLSDGTFTVNNAENASQLTATAGIEDNTPYLFRTSGGSVDIGDRENVRKIVGGTIANNQLVKNGNFASGTNNWQTNNGTLSAQNGVLTHVRGSGSGSNQIFQFVSTVTNHVLFGSYAVYNKTNANKTLCMRLGNTADTRNYSVSPNVWTVITTIKKANVDNPEFNIYGVTVNEWSEGDTLDIKECMCSDLTQAFGTTIADYVYNLETATAGAGVAWLKKHFPAQFDAGYQAYDAGSLQSVSGLTAHKMIGFNQWDEEWELGTIIPGNGQNASSSVKIRSKNYIPVIPSATYHLHAGSITSDTDYVYFYDSNKAFISVIFGSHYTSWDLDFTIPDDARYMRFIVASTTYNNDICINLSWDGERNGEYEPYVEYTYPLDESVTFRGIPKVDASGNLYYDGDEYLPDGTVNRRYGVVDLGTMDWGYNSTYAYFFKSFDNGAPLTPAGVSDFVNTKYTYSAMYTTEYNWADKDKVMCLNSLFFGNTKAILIKDTAYSDVASFKAALSGIYLVYELATPTTETADPYQETQIVDDFGTEEFILADGAFPVPVGHVTMYQNNLRAKLEMSPDSPDGDGLYVVQQESGQNEYVPLASTSTIQDILTRLTALENA